MEERYAFILWTNQAVVDQSKKWGVVIRKQNSDFISEYPELAGSVDLDLPEFITSRCIDPLYVTLAEVLAVVETRGDPGQSWCKIVNNFEDALNA